MTPRTATETAPRRTLAEIGARVFTVVQPGRTYRLDVPGCMLVLEFDRARWDRHELHGEFVATTQLLGTEAAADGVLSRASFNVSSADARTKRAMLLSKQARDTETPWHGLLEEFCQKILAAERTGLPAVTLADLERPNLDGRFIDIDGVRLPATDYSILFGDGESAKTLTALYWAGTLQRQGYRVAVFDNEMSQGELRLRLEQIFGEFMPRLIYIRLEKPLAHQVDYLQTIVRDHSINFVIHDSVAGGCAGPPEEAAVAQEYFRCLRQLGPGVGHLLIAHITKGGEHNDQRPFGSAFWHNNARATWFCKRESEGANDNEFRLALFPRKSNLGPRRPPAGYTVTFTGPADGFQSVRFTPADPATSPELAQGLTVRQRMYSALQANGQRMRIEDLAGEIDANQDSISRTTRRYRNLFVVHEGWVGLLSKVRSA